MSILQSYQISTLWNGQPADHEPIKISISKGDGSAVVNIQVDAPFFNDPGCPPSPPGEPMWELWEFEVVEAFFLAEEEERYLELEFCPYGQHLALLLKGQRNVLKKCLPLDFSAKISGGRWTGLARIPLSYFPPNVNKFNAYSIHGSGEQRTYESLYPAPPDQLEAPDFHILEYFKDIDFKSIVPENTNAQLCEVWSTE